MRNFSSITENIANDIDGVYYDYENSSQYCDEYCNYSHLSKDMTIRFSYGIAKNIASIKK
jgi:hypothetical protein